MPNDLTATDRKILLSALDVYRRVKGAEGKLAYSRALPKRPLTEDCTEANNIRDTYSRLESRIIRLVERLTA